MKLHLGSGSVYLTDYINLDLPGPKTFLASARPDLVEKLKTTEDRYYARHADKTQDSLAGGPLDQEYVCDRYGSFSNIPVGYWEVDEILSRHSFEHLSATEARLALDQIDGVLKPNGILRIDVPDSEEALEQYRITGHAFYKRHFLGPRRNDNGYHLPYTREGLRSLVEEHGFVFVAEEPNIHFHPSFCLRFVKPGPRLPVEYVELPYAIPDEWNVLEVGPGPYPFERANLYIDNDPSKLAPLMARGKAIIHADLESGLPQIEYKQFDYVWCSHVFEHLENPAKAAATLSRIAKRGTLVMPSAWKEALTNFEERDHLWSVHDGPVFIRAKAERLDQMRNTDVMKTLSRVFRTGPNGRVTEEGRILRKWWYNTEPSLDVIHHWSGELKVQVIG